MANDGQDDAWILGLAESLQRENEAMIYGPPEPAPAADAWPFGPLVRGAGGPAVDVEEGAEDAPGAKQVDAGTAAFMRGAVLPARGAMRWDALVLLREMCRTGRAAPLAAGTVTWLCNAAPLWVLTCVCELLRGGLDEELVEEASQRGQYGGLPAGLDWATNLWTGGANTFGGVGDELALPEDGFARVVFTMTPRFAGPHSQYFDKYMARMRCSVAPAALRLYGPLTVGEAMTAIGRAVMYEEHRLVFLHLFTMLPKHAGAYARFRAPRVRMPAAARMCYAEDSPVLSTAPLPDPSAGLDLPDMINLTHATYHELEAALDPHGPGCKRESCRLRFVEIPAEAPQFDLESISKLEDGSWGLEWGGLYC